MDTDLIDALLIASCWLIIGWLPTLFIAPTTQDKE